MRTAVSLWLLVAVALCALPSAVDAQTTGSLRLTAIPGDYWSAVPLYYSGGGSQVGTYSRGLLQFWYNGAWGTVCDDAFSNLAAEVSATLTHKEGSSPRCGSWRCADASRTVTDRCARVCDVRACCRASALWLPRLTVERRACHQMGWNLRAGPAGFGYTPTCFTPVTTGTGAIVLDDVVCSGTEATLNSCPHSALGTNNCGHNEDVAIDCFTYAGTTTPTGVYLTALAGDSSPYVSFEGDSNYMASDSRGLLWFQDSTSVGTVCDDNFQSNERGPEVVCRQLGWHQRSGPPGMIYSPHNVQPLISQVAAASVPIKLDDVSCAGDETNILLCSHSPVGVHNCGHSEDVAVDCFAIDPSIPTFSLTVSFSPPVSATQLIVGGDSVVLTVSTGIQRPNSVLSVYVLCSVAGPVIDVPLPGSGLFLYATLLRGNGSTTVVYNAAPTTVLQRITCSPYYRSGDTRFATAATIALSFDVHPGTQFQQLSGHAALPQGRLGAAATVINGKLVMIGGETDSGIDSACFISFDGITFVQRFIDTLPPIPRVQGALVTVGSGVGARLLLLTGFPILSAGNDVWMSDDASENDWFRVSSIPGFYGARGGAGVVTAGSTLWVMGGAGSDNTFRNDVYSASVSVHDEDMTWTTWSAAPWQARAGFATVVFREQIYVIGGVNVYGEYLNDVWRMDSSPTSATLSWLVQPSMSCSPRGGFSFGVAVNGLVIIGGTDAMGAIADACTFDAPLLWHAPRTVPFARVLATTGAMPLLNGSMLLIGGVDDMFVKSNITWLVKLDATTFSPSDVAADAGSNGGMASGVLIAIVVGAIAGGLLLFVLVMFVFCKPDRRKPNQSQVQPAAPTMTRQVQPAYAGSVQLAVVEEVPVSPPIHQQNYMASPSAPPPPTPMPSAPQTGMYAAAAGGAAVVAGSMMVAASAPPQSGFGAAAAAPVSPAGWQARASQLRNRIHIELFSTLDGLAAFAITPAQTARAQQIAGEVHALVGDLLAMQPRVTGLGFSTSPPAGVYDPVSVDFNCSPVYVSSLAPPASMSALAVGDRLVTLEGVPVESADHAAFLLSHSLLVLPGQTASLRVYRAARSVDERIDVGAAGQLAGDLAFKHQRIQQKIEQAKQLLQECSQQGPAAPLQ